MSGEDNKKTVHEVQYTFVRQEGSFGEEDNAEMFVDFNEEAMSAVINADDWRALGCPDSIIVTVQAEG